MSKKPERRYPSSNHTITIDLGEAGHVFEITITYKPIYVDGFKYSKVPINIIFNRVGGDHSSLNQIMDQLGTKLSQILEEEHKN